MNYPFPSAHKYDLVGGNPAGPTVTTSINVPVGTKILIVKEIGASGGAACPLVTGVTFGGTNLTQLASARADDKVSGFTQCGTDIWYLENPTPGTANLVTTWASTVSGELFHLWETWPNYVIGSIGNAAIFGPDPTSPWTLDTVPTPANNVILTGCAQIGGGSALPSDVTCDSIEIDHQSSQQQENMNALSALEYRPGASITWEGVSANIASGCGSSARITLTAPVGTQSVDTFPPKGDAAVIPRVLR